MTRHIAIVEDSQVEADRLQGYFSRYAQEHGDAFQVHHFPSAELFLEDYKPIYDVVLMDIMLPKANGMEAAEQLRKMDETTTLIFVTNMAQFAVKGYAVDAFDFVVKPVSYSNFALKIQRALTKLSARRDSELVITQGDQIFRVAASQIKYIEISGHKMMYHTTQGTITAYGNLKEAEENLGDKMFARCNSCYLVNLNYVKAIQGHAVVVDEDTLQISRPKRKAFVQALNDYLGGGI